MNFTNHSMAASRDAYNVVDDVSDPFGSKRNVVPYMNLGTQRLAEYHPLPTQHVRHLDPNGFYYPSLGSSYQHPRYDWQAPQYDWQAGHTTELAGCTVGQAPWYDQQALRYDQHIPFASVSTGSSTDISAGSLTERVVNNPFIHQPDTSGSSSSNTSSNQKFEKIQKISHPTAFSGTLDHGAPSPSLSRPVVSRKDMRTPCPNNCGQTFALAPDANRHYNHSCLLSDNLTRAHCHMCSKSFSRKDSLRRHVMWKHGWERGTF